MQKLGSQNTRENIFLGIWKWLLRGKNIHKMVERLGLGTIRDDNKYQLARVKDEKETWKNTSI